MSKKHHFRGIGLIPKPQWILAVAILLSLVDSATAGPRELATRLFDRLAGAPLSLKDARRAQMESLISGGKLLDAARIATGDDRFYNITVRKWATPMANREEDPLIAQFRDDTRLELNDFVAMVVGSVRDGMNAQELLNGDFNYLVNETITNVKPFQPTDYSSNEHYKSLDDAGVNLRQKLVRVTPQKTDLTDAAGLITSQAWGHAHFRDGTNRRVIHYALRQFLCTDISQLRDTIYPTTRIRRDVTRTPGGDATVFASQCKTCHGAMDGLAGATAYHDYDSIGTPEETDPPLPAGYFPGDQLMRFPNAVNTDTTVVSKMNRNGSVYAAGYVTVDDSWVNFFIQSQSIVNQEIRWPSNRVSGNGLKSLGSMLAETRGFPVCMAKRVFRKVCARDPLSTEKSDIDRLADDFVANGFKLRDLFERAAILPACLGN